MAKLIVLAHPFERLSGQVTREKQELVYNDNRNPIWNAPEGKQAALNFKPQMVVSYNSKTGKQSFRIQTKSIVDNTAPARKRMAAFGGTQAIVKVIKRDPEKLAQAYERYATLADEYKSFTSYLMKNIYDALMSGVTAILPAKAGSGVSLIYVENPWHATSQTDNIINITLDAAILQKFALYLCTSSITVDGKKVAGVPSNIMEFYGEGGFVSSKFNNGDFVAEGATTAVKYKGNSLYKENGDEVTGDDAAAGTFYTTAPNA